MVNVDPNAALGYMSIEDNVVAPVVLNTMEAEVYVEVWNDPEVVTVFQAVPDPPTGVVVKPCDAAT
jgi:hypothetical protein